MSETSTPLYTKPFDIEADLIRSPASDQVRSLVNSVLQTTICGDLDYIWICPTTESPTACQSIVLPKCPCLGLQAQAI